MADEVYQIGAIPMTVRPLGDDAIRGVTSPFVALLPATDLTRLPATMEVVIPLLRAGCASLILGGPRADAYLEQVGSVIRQQNSSTELQPLNEVGDACNAALFAALMHKAGLALCADEPEMLATLRGVAAMNGWTRNAAEAVPEPIARERSKSTKTAIPVPIAREKSKSQKMAAAKAPAKKKPAKKPAAKPKKKKR